MALTNAQMSEAIAQMIVHCKLQEETSNYEYVCARGILHTLGYSDDDADMVLQRIADGGFRYCLDSHIKCTNGSSKNPENIYPSPDVCYWGPDQLRSRLHGLYWPGD